MVAAVSPVVSQVSDSTAERESTSYHWFKMPDLNRATHRRLGQLGCGWTFETIRRLVHHVGRVGRPKARQAAKELGRLGVGLQAIADEAGVSVAKVRRDLVHLVDLGLVAVSRRNVTFKVDPATGKIVENRTGRSLPVLVFLTIGPEHCRTKAGQDRPAAIPAKAGNPPKLAPATAPDRVHSGGAIQRDLNTERVPVGQADGIGRPQAKAGRLPAAEAPGRQAGKAGGHAAAKASQEGVSVRVDAADDDLPLPIGRISRPAGKAASPPRTNKWQEVERTPQPFTGEAADAWERTRRREAEKAAMNSTADGTGLRGGSFLEEFRRTMAAREAGLEV
jgi:hypothetical protein